MQSNPHSPLGQGDPSKTFRSCLTVTRFPEIALLVLICFCGVALFHRLTIFSALDLIQADTGDSRLIFFLLEHWWSVFNGGAEWASPAMFFPQAGVLGYSDMFFGMGVPYSLLRLLGLDQFQATNAVLILLSALSYLCSYWLLRKCLGLNVAASVVGAFFFAFNHAKFAQQLHLQLRFDFFQPLALGLLLPLVLRGREVRRKEFLLRTCAVAVILAAAFSTGFYNAWFFCFFLGAALAAALLFSDLRRVITVLLKNNWRWLGLPLLLGVFLLWSFAQVYLPALQLKQDRPWLEIFQYLPTASDYLRLGPDHVLWGWWGINQASVIHPVEKNLGFGIVATILLVLGWCWSLGHFGRRVLRSPLETQAGRNRDLLAAALLAALVLTLATVRFGAVTPWELIYKFVPGASALVGVSRWALVLTLPLSILIGVVLDRLIAWPGIRRGGLKICLAGAVLLLVVEQAGLAGSYYSSREVLRYHQGIAAQIPADCGAFLLAPALTQLHSIRINQADFDEQGYLRANPDVARNWPGSAWEHYLQFGSREGRFLDSQEAAFRRAENLYFQMSALTAAYLSGKPTINGASGLAPRGYQLSNLFQTELEERLKQWETDSRLKVNSCLLRRELHFQDLETKSERALW